MSPLQRCQRLLLLPALLQLVLLLPVPALLPLLH
jgi:hypothetical protein